MKIKKLEELAQLPEVDVSEYGLKAEGFVHLVKAQEEIRKDPKNRDDELGFRLECAKEDLELATTDYQREFNEEQIRQLKEAIAKKPKRLARDYEIDPGFVVPRSVEIKDSDELRQMYHWLVSTPIKFASSFEEIPFAEYVLPQKIVLARSSDEHEMPGKFESHTSLYDPDDFESGFKRWLEAARKVRESGAGGVIGQVMVAHARKPSTFFTGDYYHDLKGELRTGMTDSPKFGLDCFGFVANTGGLLGRNAKAISAVVGLPTKLVRGDVDYSLIFRDYGTKVIHTSHDYKRNHHAFGGDNFPQKTMDIIDSSEPDKIQTIKYVRGTVMFNFSYKRCAYALPHVSPHPRDMFKILEKLKEVTGKHVEIEGLFRDYEQFPHLVQLRTYDLPENKLEKLTEIEANKLLIKDIQSFVADKFSGDLIVFADKNVDEKNIRDKLKGPYIIMTPGDFNPLADTEIDLDSFRDRQGLVLPMQKYGTITFAHAAGYMISMLTKMQDKGPVISMDIGWWDFTRPDIRQKLGDRLEEYRDFYIVRDVTVESDGVVSQIYMND